MVIAMLVGVAVEMALHPALGSLLAPLLGMFETMMPASVIGMYGDVLRNARLDSGRVRHARRGRDEFSDGLFVTTWYG